MSDLDRKIQDAVAAENKRWTDALEKLGVPRQNGLSPIEHLAELLRRDRRKIAKQFTDLLS